MVLEQSSDWEHFLASLSHICFFFCPWNSLKVLQYYKNHITWEWKIKASGNALGFRESFDLGRIEDVALESNSELLLSPSLHISRNILLWRAGKNLLMGVEMLPSWEQPREQLAQVLPQVSCSFRSELIQLVAVTQKTAERSYRELIEQQIQTYQRRSVTSSGQWHPLPLPAFVTLGALGSQGCWSSERDLPKPETFLKPK